ncbi:MAG: hypothetical protein RLZZ500_278 [Bacteroidota bacterium]|jgi:hypothetical protein
MNKIALFLFLSCLGNLTAQNNAFTTAQIDSICAIKNAKNVEILISNGDKKVLSDKQTTSGSHTIKGKGSFTLMVYNLLLDDYTNVVEPVELRKNKKDKVLLKGKLESTIHFTNGNFEKVSAIFYYQENTIQLLELTIQKKNGKESSNTVLRIPGEDIKGGQLNENIVDGMPIAEWINKKNDEILNLFKK